MSLQLQLIAWKDCLWSDLLLLCRVGH